MSLTIEKVFDYSVQTYPFVRLISDLFEIEDLSEIHSLLLKQENFFEKPGSDSATILHTRFYDRMRSGWSEFESVYRDFVFNVASNHVAHNGEFVFQKWPSFRVHLPNNVAVGGWHTDGDYNHPKGEVNFILPVTRMYESNSVIVESLPGKKDFHQIEMSPGQFLRFNGNSCLHGNLPNRTGKSRVSFDLRILDYKLYDESHNLMSLSSNKKFVIGDYYELSTK